MHGIQRRASSFNIPRIDHIHDNGLFIGNHQIPIAEAIEALALARDVSKFG